MSIKEMMIARRKHVIEMLEDRPRTGKEIASALGYCPRRGVTHIMAPMVAEGIVSSRREKNAIVYQIKPREAQRYAVPVRFITVPRHRGSTQDSPEIMRVTLPAAPWEISA